MFMYLVNMKTFKEVYEHLKFGEKSDLAKRYGVSRQAVLKWATGENRPSFDNIIRIRNDYGVPVESWI